MKKLAMELILGCSITMLVAFSQNYELKKSQAEVNTVRNLLIFTDCSPMHSYDVIGTVKIPNMSMSDHVYDQCRNKLIDKSKTKYPEGEGLIISSEEPGEAWYIAKVIKFK